MSAVPLYAHPTTPSRTVERIDVDIEGDRSHLALRYELTGSIESLLIPEPQTAKRADELWRHTCCELFVREAGANGYLEFNFSPSSAWATYRFTAYREGMLSPPEAVAPAIRCERSARQFVLRAELDVSPLRAADGALQCALACVVEDVDGTKSYWALAHPASKPDFHRREAFLL
jgi:hypothetical protein